MTEAQLFAVRKVAATVTELRKLAQQFDNATRRLEIAQTDENFAALRSAYLDIADASDRINFLAVGVQHAIESASNQQKEFRR